MYRLNYPTFLRFNFITNKFSLYDKVQNGSIVMSRIFTLRKLENFLKIFRTTFRIDPSFLLQDIMVSTKHFVIFINIYATSIANRFLSDT